MKKQANSLEWESNRASTGCTLCQSRFTLINRRHHCRNCGSLVCGSCSSNKAKIFDANAGRVTEDLQRVCDPCFTIVAAKEAKITKDIKIAENVYCLDGQHKTVCFDQSTTIGELAITLFPLAQLVMFEVTQDIFDSSQYTLLVESKLVFDVIHKWRELGIKYAKIVLPIKDSKQMKQVGVIKKLTRSLVNPSTVIEDKVSITSFDTQPTEPSAEERVKVLEEQVLVLKQELQVMVRKNETFRAVYRSRGRSASNIGEKKERHLEGNGSRRNVSSELVQSSSTNSSAPNNNSSNNATTIDSEVSRRDSFKWGMGSRSFFRSSSTNIIGRNNKSIESSPNNSKPSNDISEVTETTQSIMDVSKKAKSSRPSKQQLEYNESNMPNLTSDIDLPTFESNRKQRIDRISVDDEEASSENGINFISSVPFGNNPLELTILQDPSTFFQQDDKNTALFVRTFFNHIINLEGFLGQYSACLDVIMKRIVDGKTNTNDNNSSHHHETMLSSWIIAVYHMTASMDTLFFAVSDMIEIIRPQMHSWLTNLLRTLLKLPPSNPEALKAVFLCLWKERLLFEDEIRKVLESTLEQALKKDIRMISNTTGTDRELFGRWWSTLSPSPQNCSFTVIEMYMHNIISTQRSILGDLMSIVPPELSCTTIFQDLSWQVWDEVIKPWYRSQAPDLPFSPAIAIYQFLETYADLLLQFGSREHNIEKLLDKVKLKRAEMFKLTCAAIVQDTKNVWKSCISSASVEIIQGVSSVGNGGNGNNNRSISTANISQDIVQLPVGREPYMRWSQELVSFISVVFTAVVDYNEPSLQPSKIRTTVVMQLLDTLFEGGLQQLDFVHSLRSTEEDFPLKITAFLNSQLIFINSFVDTAERAMNRLPEDITEMVDQKVSVFVQQREDVCEAALESLARQWAAEIKRIFEVDLFKKQWETEVKTLLALKKTLRFYLEQFKSSLVTIGEVRSAALRMRLAGYICEAIVHGYIECLLSNNHSMTLSVVVIERLNEDLQLITALIEELRMMMLGNQEIHRVQSDAQMDPRSKAKDNARKKRFTLKPAVVFKKEDDLKIEGVDAELSEEQLLQQQQKLAKRTIDYQNKQSYDLMIQPLTHLILAAQMSKQYLLPFVREELYNDFGPLCLTVWCLIEHWRGEKKEQIQQDYDNHLKSWRPPGLIDEPRINISFINKVRAANQVKQIQQQQQLIPMAKSNSDSNVSS